MKLSEPLGGDCAATKDDAARSTAPALPNMSDEAVGATSMCAQLEGQGKRRRVQRRQLRPPVMYVQAGCIPTFMSVCVYPRTVLSPQMHPSGPCPCSNGPVFTDRGTDAAHNSLRDVEEQE